MAVSSLWIITCLGNAVPKGNSCLSVNILNDVGIQAFKAAAPIQVNCLTGVNVVILFIYYDQLQSIIWMLKHFQCFKSH